MVQFNFFSKQNSGDVWSLDCSHDVDDDDDDGEKKMTMLMIAMVITCSTHLFVFLSRNRFRCFHSI